MSNQRALAIVFLIIFVNLLGFGIVIPLLPLYASKFQASGLQIGLLFAIYSLCQIVASPLLGGLSDRVGRRPILLFSLLGTVISFVMLALAGNLFWLFAARIVDGLSGGNISTARAYISDITTEKDRAKAYGMIGAAFGLGFVFGPALAGLLGNLHAAAPAWAAAVLSLLALLFTFFWLPETNRVTSTQRNNSWRNIPRLLTKPILGSLLFMDLVYWAAFSVYHTTFALFGQARFGWGISEVGYILALVGVIGAVIQGGVVGPIVRRFGEKQTYLAGVIMAGIGLALAAYSYDWRLFLIAMIPAAVGGALSNPTLVAMISQAGDHHAQGQAQGVSSAMESIGRTIGPVWGNGILDAFGEGQAYLSAALVLGLLALWGLQIRRTLSMRSQVTSEPLTTENQTEPTSQRARTSLR